MKKIVSLIALLLVVSSGSAFAMATIAAGADVKAGVASSEKSIAKLSTGVSAKIAYDTTAYAAATKHANGTKEFGSSSGDTRIYSKENATLDDISVSDSSAFSGWSSL